MTAQFHGVRYDKGLNGDLDQLSEIRSAAVPGCEFGQRLAARKEPERARGGTPLQLAGEDACATLPGSGAGGSR